MGQINNTPALVQIMAWHRPGDKPLSETMMVRLPTHICDTRCQWVKNWWYNYKINKVWFQSLVNNMQIHSNCHIHLMGIICRCSVLTPLVYHCYAPLAFILGGAKYFFSLRAYGYLVTDSMNFAKYVFIYSAQNHTYILYYNCLIRIDMLVSIFSVFSNIIFQATPCFLALTYQGWF